jgi:hypothetical protein
MNMLLTDFDDMTLAAENQTECLNNPPCAQNPGHPSSSRHIAPDRGESR